MQVMWMRQSCNICTTHRAQYSGHNTQALTPVRCVPRQAVWQKCGMEWNARSLESRSILFHATFLPHSTVEHKSLKIAPIDSPLYPELHSPVFSWSMSSQMFPLQNSTQTLVCQSFWIQIANTESI